MLRIKQFKVMSKSTEILNELSREEQQEAARFIAYRREIAASGCRPIIAASRGKNTKILGLDDDSLTEFVDELLKPEMLAAKKEADPLFEAKLRGVKAKKQMLETEGEPWSSSDVAQYLGVALNTVSKKRRLGKILGLHCGSCGYLFPSWQFQSNQVLSGLDQVLQVLNDGLIPDWDKLRFFVTSDYLLEGKTPLTCLRSGKIEAVAKAANAYGVQNAS